jgi:hypothetical protein
MPAQAGHPVTRARRLKPSDALQKGRYLLDRPLSRTMTTEKRFLRAGDGSGPVGKDSCLAPDAVDPSRRWLDVAAPARSWYLSLVEKDQERHW